MTNTLLRDTDAMSMAHSLEVRVPFVDMKVVDYVLSLPGDWKLRNGYRKTFARRCARAICCREIFWRDQRWGSRCPSRSGYSRTCDAKSLQCWKMHMHSPTCIEFRSSQKDLA